MRPMLTILVSISLGFLLFSGSLAVVAPHAWTTIFGLPTIDPSALAFARVAGAREIVLATVAIVLIKRGTPGVATVTIGLSTLIGVADFSVVFALRGTSAAIHLAIHAGSLMLLFLTWLGLRLGAR